MLAINTGIDTLRAAASRAGVSIAHGWDDKSSSRRTATRFRLALDSKRSEGRDYRFQRMNHTHTRRVAAVCWHGHRDFFRALFELAPAARVRISARMAGNMTEYTADNFEATFPHTGYANIGSVHAPCRYRDACTCEE